MLTAASLQNQDASRRDLIMCLADLLGTSLRYHTLLALSVSSHTQMLVVLFGMKKTSITWMLT